jgi:hypothetical protein
MWSCKNCSESIDDALTTCWSCGFSADGVAPSTDLREAIKVGKGELKAERDAEKRLRAELQAKQAELQAKQSREVTIVDVQIPFWSMVFLMVKWAFASIPALLIVVTTTFVFATLLGALFGR